MTDKLSLVIDKIIRDKYKNISIAKKDLKISLFFDLIRQIIEVDIIVNPSIKLLNPVKSRKTPFERNNLHFN